MLRLKVLWVPTQPLTASRKCFAHTLAPDFHRSPNPANGFLPGFAVGGFSSHTICVFDVFDWTILILELLVQTSEAHNLGQEHK